MTHLMRGAPIQVVRSDSSPARGIPDRHLPAPSCSVVVNAGDSGAGDAAGVVVNAGDAGAALAVTPYISNRHRGTIGPAHLV